MPEDVRENVSNHREEKAPTPEQLRNAEAVGKAQGTMPMPGFEDRRRSANESVGMPVYPDLGRVIERSTFRTTLAAIETNLGSDGMTEFCLDDGHEVTIERTPDGTVLTLNEQPTDVDDLTELFENLEESRREAALRDMRTQNEALRAEREREERRRREREERKKKNAPDRQLPGE